MHPAPDIIHRQVLLCHRVLRTLHKIAHDSQTLTRDTWEALLLFLLAINDILLAPPLVRDDVADKLCERVLSVLFEVWLLACARCFPAPSLWKTLQESCAVLRHRIALIEQWNRVCLALTARLLAFTYGPQFPELRIGEWGRDMLVNDLHEIGYNKSLLIIIFYELHPFGQTLNSVLYCPNWTA